MPIEIRLIKYQSTNTQNKNNVPVTIAWNGVTMIRNHSLRASVKEIVTTSHSLDVVKINIVGEAGTGKSTLAMTLGHLIHKISQELYNMPFAVKIFNRDALLNFEATLKTLEPTNWVLVFDDVSFLEASASKRQIDVIKEATTRIRHLPGGQDVKIIIIMNFHYSLAVTKYLRQAKFWYITTVGSSELKNYQELVGVNYTPYLIKLQRLLHTAHIKQKFSFRFGRTDKHFTYEYRKPFIPVLFHNGQSLRFVVSPTREWIDEFCSTCTASKEVPMKNGISISDFAKDFSDKFGPQIARNATRIKLFQNGLNVYPKSVKQAMMYLDRYTENKFLNLQALADFYEFKNERTRLDEKIPDEPVSAEPVN